MKAAIYNRYGPPEVLKIEEVDKPIPKDNEVLVRVHKATVTSGDVRLRASDFPPLFWLPARLIFGLFKPKRKILGHELAGVVEATGDKVTRFKVGDEVFGTTTMLKAGSYADYVCLPQKWKSGVLTHKPSNLSFESAAALPIGAMTALFLWEKAKLSKGQKVLVYGASGSVGTYAVQLAKRAGAKVHAVCSKQNFDMVRALGAEVVLDYRTQDYSSQAVSYDIVFDAVGKTKRSKAKKVLLSKGKFVSVTMPTQEKDDKFERLKSMAEIGELRAYIDREYNLNDIVEAHRYVDQGHKKGNVVIHVSS